MNLNTFFNLLVGNLYLIVTYLTDSGAALFIGIMFCVIGLTSHIFESKEKPDEDLVAKAYHRGYFNAVKFYSKKQKGGREHERKRNVR